MPDNWSVAREVKQYLPSGLKDSTCTAYVNLLRQLWAKALQRHEAELLTWDWHKPDDAKAWHGRWTRIFHKELLAWVHGSSLKDTTKRNYINAIHMTHHDDADMRRHTSKHISDLSKCINSNEGLQMRDDKEQLWGRSHEDLLGITKRMEADFKLCPAVQLQRSMTPREETVWCDMMFAWLAMMCYVVQPPIRGEWGNMLVAQIEQCVDSGQNYYVMDLDSPSDLILINTDKVVSKSGPGLIVMEPEVQDAVRLTLFLYPRKYVFPSRPDRNKPHKFFTNYLRTILHPVTHEPLNQGVQLLRSSYITWFYDRPGCNHNDKVDLAARMRHSWQMAEVNYNKIVVEV